MGKGIEIELNRDQVAAFMSDDLFAHIDELTAKVANAAGTGCDSETKRMGTRAVGKVWIDQSELARLCKSDKPFKHPNCSATAAAQDAHIKLIAAMSQAG